MRYQMAADCAADVTRSVTENLPFTLSGTALILFRALHQAGGEVSRFRGYVRSVSVVHFFVPGEVVADACCMARSTLYRKLAELEALGLVEGRAHYVTHKGRTRADGMVWAVKMRFDTPGAAKVPHDALKASYRCLSADIEAGRTAWALLRQSKKTPIKQVDVSKILAWALPPVTTQKPDKGMTVRPDLEQVLDVPHVDKAERAGAVDRAAQMMAAALSDRGGLMFYRWLLWRLLREQDAGRGDFFYSVYLMAQRARTDRAEGFARKPGALFVSRLKGAPFWEDLRRAPVALRVGKVPKA